eukprot:Hpha_TRINITY_DN16340_c2_g1::TRINITY_DN16340_c2_g1_i11::g.59989::m.59989
MGERNRVTTRGGRRGLSPPPNCKPGKVSAIPPPTGKQTRGKMVTKINTTTCVCVPGEDYQKVSFFPPLVYVLFLALKHSKGSAKMGKYNSTPSESQRRAEGISFFCS